MSKTEWEQATAGLEKFFGKTLLIDVLDNNGKHRIKGRPQRFTSLKECRMGYRLGAIVKDLNGNSHWTTLELLEEAEILES